MKRKFWLMVSLIGLLLLTSCSKPTNTHDPSVMQTYVAQTIEAEFPATVTPHNYGFVMFTSTPGPTNTPVPTLVSRNIIESIVDDIRLNDYCNAELVPEIIKKFRLLDENADSYFNGEITSWDINNQTLFSSEEDQKIAVEGMEKIIAEVEAIKVPECLKAAKTKILFGYEELLNVFLRNDINWFGDLVSAAFIGESGRQELERIEQCLPIGCK